jgi:multiple sugar transport system ATP-binding protein
MNLVDCRLSDGVADLGGPTLALPAELAARGRGNAQLKLGVRPENLSLSPGSDHDIAIPAEVSLLEPLGAETLVTFRVGQAELVARCSAAFKDAPGAVRTIYVHPQFLHLFDPQTGEAL